MHTNDPIKKLYLLAVSLGISFICAVISVASDGWSNEIGVPLLTLFEETGRTQLWLVGVAVLLILGIICLSITGLIVMSRFFNHGQGRAILGGVLCIFTAVVFVIALAVFMVQMPPARVYYGYSFGFLWVGVIFSILTGAVFFTLEDEKFLM